MSLFDDAAEERRAAHAPLADRLRPRALDEFAGQPQLVGEGAALRRAIEEDRVSSSLFFGPPGTGKTTLARIIAASTQSVFEELSAVSSGKADVQAVIGRARERLGAQGQRTVLFIDEIHRFNKAQQDALLPVVESGLVTLIGATTENPFHSVIGALVSRCRLYEFTSHSRGRAAGRARARRGRARRPAGERRGARRDRRDGGGRRAPRALDARARARARALARRSAAVEDEDVTAAVHAPSRALRPRRRQPLRHDLGVHQERARERSRRGALLPRGHARGRRGPGLHRAPHRDPRERGHRQRRPARARAGRRRARASSSWSACPSARYALSQATAYLALAPKSNTAGTSLARRARGRARARDRAPAGRPARLPATAAPASSAAAWATATRTTRPGRSWPTITCRPSSPARASTSRPSTASRPSSPSACASCGGCARADAEAAQMMRWPSAEQISSTASSPVMFSRSRIGFTSTTSSEPTAPASETSSIARCASR